MPSTPSSSSFSPDPALLEKCRQAAVAIQEIPEFKDWTRQHLRPLLPHGALACVHGKTYGVGVSLDCIVVVDYPLRHLQAIRNSSGHMDTPLARRWFEQEAPVFFDADHPAEDIPPAWLRAFRKHHLKNAVANGVLDPLRCTATYFSFHRLPELHEERQGATLKVLSPLLHETFSRVVRHHQAKAVASLQTYLLLTDREQQIALYISNAKSNADVAKLLGISENTVKNHVRSMMEKTGCSNRAGLAAIAILQATQQAGGGPKVL